MSVSRVVFWVSTLIISVYMFLVTCGIKNTAESNYKAALDYYVKYEFEEAIPLLRKALSKDAYLAPAYKRLVDCFKLTNELDGGVEYFEKLGMLNPDNPYAPHALGLLYIEKAEYSKAVMSFKKGITESLRQHWNYAGLILAYHKSDSVSHGIEFMAQLAQADTANAYPYVALADAYDKQKRWDDALHYSERAIRLEPDLFEAHYLKIKALRGQIQYEEASLHFSSIIESVDGKRDLETKVRLLISEARNQRDLGDANKAIEFLEKAMSLSDELGLIYDKSNILNTMGVFYRELGKYDEGMNVLMSAVAISRILMDRELEGRALGNIGDIHIVNDRYDSSMVYYGRALAIAEETDDKEGQALNNGAFSNVWFFKGEYQLSLEYSKKAVELDRELNNMKGLTYNLGNIGTVYLEWGDYEKALQYFSEGLVLADSLKEKYMQTVITGDIGEIYHLLGNNKKALEYLEKAEQSAIRLDNPDLIGAWLASKAAVHLAEGDTTQGVDGLEGALAIQLEKNAQRDAATTLTYLGRIHTKQGHYEQAKASLDSALIINERIGNQYGVASCHNALGELYFKKKDYAIAKAHLDSALSLASLLSLPEILWQVHADLGLLYDTTGDNSLALEHEKQAITNIESMRAHLSSKEHKQSFFSKTIDIYGRVIRRLCQPAYNNEAINAGALEAFHFAERAKARTLLEMLTEAKVPLRAGVPSDLKKAEADAFRRISEIQTELQILEKTSEKRQPLLKQLEEKEESISDLRLKLRRANPLYTSIKYPKPLTLKQTQEQVLDNDEVLLEYSLGEKQSYLWAITRQSHAVFRLPPRETIRHDVRQYIRIISRPPNSGLAFRKLGHKLYKLLIGPAEDWLDQTTNLLIVPDGILHYLAFETLITQARGKKPEYLLESHSLRYAQSASVLGILRKRHEERHSTYTHELLAFADPVFGTSEQSSLTPSIQLRNGLGRLPATALEVRGIASLFPTDRQVVTHFRQDATEDRLKSEDLTKYRYLHLATHAIFDEKLPQRSSIILTLDQDPAEDGFLQLRELFNLQLDASLVVLSACQTGQGKYVAGEGLLGLAHGFYYAGANSIVMTLWSVTDQITAGLMISFYRYLLQGKTASAALRQAKLQLLSGEIAAKRHPYYWAPFVLSGINIAGEGRVTSAKR